MPTIDQGIELLKKKREKFGGAAHINQIVVSEESRQEAIENKPDAAGRQKTRIGLETYSPDAYKRWNELVEWGMEKCGFNPIFFVDVVYTILHLAGDEGFMVAHDQLCKMTDYPQLLSESKAARRNLRRSTNQAPELGSF